MSQSEIKPGRNVTQLLVRWGTGDSEALNELIPIVYDELRKLASNSLRRRRGNLTIQPTALVHEAYVKLADQTNTHWENRAQFFGLAAKLMHDIIVDEARKRFAIKRGGGQLRVSLSQADRFAKASEVELLELEDALKELANTNPQHARIVELRFFGGLTIEETAEVLGISHTTVERNWTFAKAWLRRQLIRK
jgi:RNA polymerase sigma factor (TIGR02999 family)